MIRIESIRRQFGPRLLFDDLSWTIPADARLGLVGPNGAGKTTLLRILEGRDQPDAGAVHRPQALQVGYLPQEVETVEAGSALTVVLAGFEQLARVEQAMEDLERQLEALDAGDSRGERLTARYGELRDRFEALDGDRIEARAKLILSGLGVQEPSWHRPLEHLSGGWRMRVVLARLLLACPGLLLLDEPTNHLDLEAIDWLEGFLADYRGAFVIVSHDRYFLNRMVSGIVELEHGRLSVWTGNYDAYIEQQAIRRAAAERAAKQQERELAKTRRFIERFRYKNTKASLVQSRVKALARVERVRLERSTKAIRFGFPPAPRAGDVVVRAEGVAKRYGHVVVYDSLDLLLRRGDRVALVGPNGTGKSTMLKLLAGQLEPDGGRLELGHNVIPRYYAQHQLDDLDPRSTVLEEMEKVAEAGERPRLRKLLGGFLFSDGDVDKKVAVLSGGEKARLALCKMLSRPSNLLLLDEPTNHLDLRSREVLEDALNEYAGSLIVISHDRYFINRIATSVGEIAGGRVELFVGDYDAHLEWKRRRAEHAARVEDVASARSELLDPTERQRRRETKRSEAERRNRAYRQRKEAQRKLAPLESRIHDLEREADALERQQADPEVYRDPQRAADVGRRKAEVDERLRRAYAEWEAQAAALEDGAGS